MVIDVGADGGGQGEEAEAHGDEDYHRKYYVELPALILEALIVIKEPEVKFKEVFVCFIFIGGERVQIL